MLDPEIQAIVEMIEAAPGPPAHLVPIAQARTAHDRESALLSGAGEEVAEVRELDVPGPAGPIRVRAFRPLEERAAPGADVGAPDRPGAGLPLVAYLHGGGWAVGTLDAFDPL